MKHTAPANPSAPVKHAFILGCERSGSTWLSNVLNTSASVEFYMEPFADYAGIFPGFPNRNTYLQSPSAALLDLVRQQYATLNTLKQPYNQRRGKTSAACAHFSQWMASKAAGFGGLRLPIRTEQFRLLTLNQSQVPGRFLPKRAHTTRIVTKELRLNFKLAMLNATFSNPQIIITVRHPGPQIDSILKLFDRNHLGELRRALVSFPDHVSDSMALQRYRAPMAGWDKLSMPDRLLAWWSINYDVLIRDCKALQLDYRIIWHERLALDPAAGFKKLFAFLDLPFCEITQQYIDYSTNAQDHTISSPVDTVRNASKDIPEGIARITQDRLSLIADTFHRFDVDSDLSRCLQTA